MQKLKVLAVEFRFHEGDTRRVEERVCQVGGDACRYRIRAEFVDDRYRPITLHHDRCRCSVGHDQLDMPPLKFGDELRDAIERIIGVEAFEAQRAGLVITLGSKSIAQCRDKRSRAFLVTAADKPHAHRLRAFHRRGAASRSRRFMHGWLLCVLSIDCGLGRGRPTLEIIIR